MLDWSFTVHGQPSQESDSLSVGLQYSLHYLVKKHLQSIITTWRSFPRIRLSGKKSCTPDGFSIRNGLLAFSFRVCSARRILLRALTLANLWVK
jgi:hypothetical protein